MAQSRNVDTDERAREDEPLLPTAHRARAPSHPSNVNKTIDLQLDKQIHLEFGGPIGVTIMMIFFPSLMYYFWICIEFNNGHLAHPASLDTIGEWSLQQWDLLVKHAAPNVFAVTSYTIFIFFQFALAAFMPGPVVKGLPVPSLGFKQLEYLCNGLSSWYATIVASVIMHYTGLMPISRIIDNFGPLMTVSMIFGFGVTIATYLYGVLCNKSHRMSGYVMYDIFMGAVLNPRIGIVDLKIWAEIRIPWVLLFYITVSAAFKEWEVTGAVRPEVLFMVLAHALYVNACMKGEECIPTTWDIFYEKWGFMLIFWNFSGVPFTYCYSSLYLLKTETGRSINHHPVFLVFEYALLILAYYVWDTANSQKNRFRMSQSGTYIPRKAFPQLPWGTIVDPTYITTQHGSQLLTSGWWGVARKIHYTADLSMALSWGLICGFDSWIPYFYVVFFTCVLVHRVSRDMERCKQKYGADWDAYCEKVPYIFIPYVY
ncbi:ergosterol biosynthesis ERG4/ERG24 [Fimicolochytrium jonesii]|uniref:ergosterol biosynthesis ERG4/ERG24 n=1 Tax=Fimicolochytrium jonesii TaxID=1396493 RepID=UPI0022FE99FF|nr:ergosterol biosynthesis ERG4/ERG24 [Fimicolochytrium jonesii]KAI8822166.1 ergosterol biosynthesis ERG4/ERG24 [Fimicolochytrium jonesii]